MQSLEIKRNVIEHIIYEIETEFDKTSTINALKNINFQQDFMVTTFKNKDDIFSLPEFIDLKNHLMKYFEIFTTNVLKKENFKVIDSWIQAYSLDDYHPLHVHEIQTERTYSCVFYIQSSANSSDTRFYAPGWPYTWSPEIIVNPKESKLVLFHGSTPHLVSPNNDDQRIVLSCNFECY